MIFLDHDSELFKVFDCSRFCFLGVWRIESHQEVSFSSLLLESMAPHFRGLLPFQIVKGQNFYYFNILPVFLEMYVFVICFWIENPLSIVLPLLFDRDVDLCCLNISWLCDFSIVCYYFMFFAINLIWRECGMENLLYDFSAISSSVLFARWCFKCIGMLQTYRNYVLALSYIVDSLRIVMQCSIR